MNKGKKTENKKEVKQLTIKKVEKQQALICHRT